MDKHSRPEPSKQPSRAVPSLDTDDRLAAYEKRRRPPLDVHRRHRPLHWGGGHLWPEEPRALEDYARSRAFAWGFERVADGSSITTELLPEVVNVWCGDCLPKCCQNAALRRH